MDKQKTPEILQQEYQALIESQQTLMLASLGKEQMPDASYAPYIRDENGVFYIYVSELAKHTQNLMRHPYAGIIFIRPEAESRNLFARERVSFRCQVTEVSRNEEPYEGLLENFRDRFGAVVDMLSSLPDFHLLALKPESGSYVVGFGRAYAIDCESGALQHIDADQLKAGR